MRAGVEPGEAAAEHLDAQLPAFEVGAVDVGDLQFAAGEGLQRRGDLDDLRCRRSRARSRRSWTSACAGFSSMQTHLPAASNSTTP